MGLKSRGGGDERERVKDTGWMGMNGRREEEWPESHTGGCGRKVEWPDRPRKVEKKNEIRRN